jgi:hypothetical protein
LTDVILETDLSEERVAQILMELEEKGKADFTLDLKLIDANEEVVCIVQGIWQGRKMTPEVCVFLSQISR